MENSKAMTMDVHTENGVEKRRIERFQKDGNLGGWSRMRPVPELREGEEHKWAADGRCIIVKGPIVSAFLERVEFIPQGDREIAVAYYSDGTQVEVSTQEARDLIASMMGDDE
ncbi:hypothetical protein D3C80_518760 [compost metagenome]